MRRLELLLRTRCGLSRTDRRRLRH